MFLLYLKVFILALIQGVTEFVPVSSSGHLVLLHDFLDLHLASDLLFDIALHFGTILALLLYFRKRIKSFLEDSRLLAKVFIALVPTVLIGFFLEDYIDQFVSNTVIALALIGGGILFLLSEELFRTPKTLLSQIKFSDGFWIGLWQSLALIPGVSRSGITIIAGMSRGLKKSVAAEFSFLLAIPLISGIALKKVLDGLNGDLALGAWSDFMILLFGILVAAIIGYLVVKYFLEYLNKHSLKVFAWYRIALGLLVLMFVYWGL